VKKLIHTLHGKTGDKNWQKQVLMVDFLMGCALWGLAKKFKV